MANPFKKRNLKKIKKLNDQYEKVNKRHIHKNPFNSVKINKEKLAKKIKNIKTPNNKNNKHGIKHFIASPIGSVMAVSSIMIITILILSTMWYISNQKNLNEAGALVAILSDDKYRAELKSKGLLGDEAITSVNGNVNKKSDNKTNDDSSGSVGKGTKIDHFMLSSVKGYGNDVSEEKLTANLGKSTGGTGGKSKEIMDYAKEKDINLLSFCIISTIEGGGAGNYINHFMKNTSSDGLQRFKDDAVIWCGKKGDATANGGTLVGGAFDDDDTVFNYATTSGFFSPRGIHDLAFSDNWHSVASKENMKKNAPKGSVGRYGIYQTAAIAYPAMTGKPMPSEPGYPSGGPDFNNKSVIEPIANKYKK